MKKFILIFVLFSSVQALAEPNILCVYYSQQDNWEAIPGFSKSYDKDAEAFELGNIAIGIQELEDGHALCSRSIQNDGKYSDLVEQAHYINSDDSAVPDAKTCDYDGDKPFKTISRITSKVSPGSYVEVSYEGEEAIKILHYIPTAEEAEVWTKAKAPADYNHVLQKCLTLVKGSIPLPESAIEALPRVRFRMSR